MAPTDPRKQSQSESAVANNSKPNDGASAARPTVDTETSLTIQTPDKSSKRSSWYSRTWPGKGTPIAQVAHESISSASNTASEVLSSVQYSAKPQTKRTPSINLTLRKGSSSRSTLADTETTRVNAVSTRSAQPPTKSKPEVVAQQNAQSELGNNDARSPQSRPASEGPVIDDNSKTLNPPKSDESRARRTTDVDRSSDSANAFGGPGWLGWLSRSTAEPEKTSNSAPPSLRSPDPPLPPPEALKHPQAPGTDKGDLPPVPGDAEPTSSKRSWLQMWNGGSVKQDYGNAKDTENEPSDRNIGKIPEVPSSGEDKSATSGSQVPPTEPSAPPTLPEDSSKSSGWVFWSRDRKTDSSAARSDEPHVGEIAISDTPSQKRPRRASISLESSKPPDSPREPPKPVTKSQGTAKAKDISEHLPKNNVPPTPTKPTLEGQKEGALTPTSASLPAKEASASKQLQNTVPNLLLPSFHDTFSLQETPSLFQLVSRLLKYNKHAEDRILHRVKDVAKLNSALAIGVHGYFPAPLLRTVLGQPTGTSIKFADMAAKAIRKWTERRGYSCEVKTAALEGEGRIGERVDLLWKLLLNWIDEIRKADFVMVACHSQGVPVAVMLVAKLVGFGCVNSAKIGICAMAGVSLGPFPDYKSRWIGGTAGELFDFSNPSSTVSKDYLAAVETVLKFGVRVVYIGSIDDQLVSLESSTFSPISHPHIYRAVFVDGRIHAPNFLVHLVGFALKLRNLGVQDHGLIRELSWPLAGSLYTGEGHSRIYEDSAVYDLAVEFAIETTTIQNAPLSQKPSPTPSSNPYILPWAVRGILEEDFVKSDLRDEANQLLKQFDEWNPTTKVLKDVKFRLEGIRSKL